MIDFTQFLALVALSLTCFFHFNLQKPNRGTHPVNIGRDDQLGLFAAKGKQL